MHTAPVERDRRVGVGWGVGKEKKKGGRVGGGGFFGLSRQQAYSERLSTCWRILQSV